MARQTVLCCSAVFGALLALVATPSAASAAPEPEPVEVSSKLIWTKAPDQPIDAIYRRAWGNCSAWKVPDSADVWVKSATKFEICQNAAAAALGHYVRIATTCKGGTEPGWPDNPL